MNKSMTESQVFRKEFKEHMYNPQDHIVTRNAKNKGIYYIARGICIEKDGEYGDKNVPHLKLTKGHIACLQNLLPNTEEENEISDLYCHDSGYTSVIKLDNFVDVGHLKKILLNDPNKMLKLWEKLAHRMIILHSEELP